jgi:hypothetical protein
MDMDIATMPIPRAQGGFDAAWKSAANFGQILMEQLTRTCRVVIFCQHKPSDASWIPLGRHEIVEKSARHDAILHITHTHLLS